MKKVVVLGGYGTFGRLITEQLIAPEVDLVIAGRNPRQGEAYAQSIQARYLFCDVEKDDSLRQAIAGAYLVVNASGPFQAMNYTIPQTCLEEKSHYIDLGDGRDYVAGIGRLHQQAQDQQCFVCVGASTSPAITSAAVANLRPHFQTIDSIEVALSAGNKNQAGVSTIASILTYVGIPMQVWQDGLWQPRWGWGEGKFVTFPPPVGKRRVQLCNVPDLELFPQLFEAENVIFRAGVELTMFNYALALLGRMRQKWPRFNLPALAQPLVRLSEWFKFLGTFHGGCAVWVTGDDGRQRAVSLVAPSNGPRIPAAPAILLSRKLLAEEPPVYGAFPCMGFLSLAEFGEHLAPYGITFVYGENGGWRSS